jgi:sigma-B regulation protein RsbU (phosphoserine phosphatase)
MIANAQSSLRTAALFAGNDMAALLKAVSLQVHASSLTDRYATLFYGVFDEAARTLRYVNAGHNPPDDIVHSIFASMDEFSRAHQGDDATVAVLRAH